MKFLTENQVPKDVKDRMESGAVKGRRRTELRRAIDAMVPGDVLDTGMEVGSGYNARKVRAMLDSIRIAGNELTFSVMSSRDLDRVVVWCKPIEDDDEDKRADEQLARDNGEWEQR